jgi:hypothetical protein
MMILLHEGKHIRVILPLRRGHESGPKSGALKYSCDILNDRWRVA